MNFGVINVSHSELFDSKKAACVAGVQRDGGRGVREFTPLSPFPHPFLCLPRRLLKKVIPTWHGLLHSSFSVVVTLRFWGGALRDDTQNGCVALVAN